MDQSYRVLSGSVLSAIILYDIFHLRRTKNAWYICTAFFWMKMVVIIRNIEIPLHFLCKLLYHTNITHFPSSPHVFATKGYKMRRKKIRLSSSVWSVYMLCDFCVALMKSKSILQIKDGAVAAIQWRCMATGIWFVNLVFSLLLNARI